ncbi:hypothetical protein, partial [Bacillus cereus group sp. BC327]|uniref:hypothetical protein n=1 Tax=Bacillus cereus group sp. BC327 TaxID=3445309 RepID=UPI003F69D9E7
FRLGLALGFCFFPGALLSGLLFCCPLSFLLTPLGLCFGLGLGFGQLTGLLLCTGCGFCLALRRRGSLCFSCLLCGARCFRCWLALGRL